MNTQQRFEMKAVSLLVKSGFSRTQRQDNAIVGSSYENEYLEVSPETIRKFDAKVQSLSQALRRKIALVYDPARCVFSAHVPIAKENKVRFSSRSICRLGGLHERSA